MKRAESPPPWDARSSVKSLSAAGTSLVATRRESPQAPSALNGSSFWKRLRLLRRGSLAVPASEGQPALPPRTNQPSFSEKPPLFAPSGLGEIPERITVALEAESPKLRRRRGRTRKIRNQFFSRPHERRTTPCPLTYPSFMVASSQNTFASKPAAFIWQNNFYVFSSVQLSSERPPKEEILLSKHVGCGGVSETARGVCL